MNEICLLWGVRDFRLEANLFLTFVSRYIWFRGIWEARWGTLRGRHWSCQIQQGVWMVESSLLMKQATTAIMSLDNKLLGRIWQKGMDESCLCKYTSQPFSKDFIQRSIWGPCDHMIETAFLAAPTTFWSHCRYEIRAGYGCLGGTWNAYVDVTCCVL